MDPEDAGDFGAGAASASIARISALCRGMSLDRRPPFRPCSRAAFNPARVRSRTMARSNSAKDPSICIIMRPAGPEVSIASVKERKLAAAASIFSRM
jgi:hypothetical protein